MAALGRQGGLRGGLARAKALTAEEKTAIARKAARTRWSRPVLVIDASRQRVARRGPPQVTLEVVVAVRAEHLEAATAHVLGILGVGQGDEKSS